MVPTVSQASGRQMDSRTWVTCRSRAYINTFYNDALVAGQERGAWEMWTSV